MKVSKLHHNVVEKWFVWYLNKIIKFFIAEECISVIGIYLTFPKAVTKTHCW